MTLFAHILFSKVKHAKYQKINFIHHPSLYIKYKNTAKFYFSNLSLSRLFSSDYVLCYALVYCIYHSFLVLQEIPLLRLVSIWLLGVATNSVKDL